MQRPKPQTSPAEQCISLSFDGEQSSYVRAASAATAVPDGNYRKVNVNCCRGATPAHQERSPLEQSRRRLQRVNYLVTNVFLSIFRSMTRANLKRPRTRAHQRSS